MEYFPDLVVFFKVLNALLFIYIWYKKQISVELKVFTVYLVLLALIDLGASYYASNKWHNLFFTHYYFIIQFLLLSIFYYLQFQRVQRKFVIGVLLVVICILGVVYFIYPEKLKKINLLEVLVTSLPIILYCLIHLYNSLASKDKYMFINSGLLIYISLSTLLFFLGNLLFEQNEDTISSELALQIWGINNILLFIFQILIFIEWRKSMKILRSNKI